MALIKKIRQTDRIYISGPISYNPRQAQGRFARIEHSLRWKGYSDVINPEKTLRELAKTMDHNELMKICKTLLELSDVVLLMNDWQISVGATMEVGMALAMGKRVLVISEDGDLQALNY